MAVFSLFFSLQRNICYTLLFLCFDKLLVRAVEILPSVGGDLNDAVSDSVDDLIVVRGEQNVALKVRKTVINSGNGF